MSALPLHIGLLLPTSQSGSGGASVGSLLELARTAETAGIDSIWVGDALFARPRYDPLTLLAAIAGATSTARIGTAVVIAPMWNPLLLARAVTTLDHVADGRLILGVGAGPSYGPAKKELAALGIPSEGRLTRLLEILAICRLVWQEEACDHQGALWSFRNVTMLPKPVQAGGPPIWLGGSGPRTLAAAGRLFDAWLPVPTSPEAFAHGLAEVRSAAAEAGREPAALAGAAYVTLSLDEDADRAEKNLRVSMERYYNAPWERVAELQDSYAGSATGAVGWLHRYVAAGAGGVVLRFAGDDAAAQLAALSPHLGELRS